MYVHVFNVHFERSQTIKNTRAALSAAKGAEIICNDALYVASGGTTNTGFHTRNVAEKINKLLAKNVGMVVKSK